MPPATLIFSGGQWLWLSAGVLAIGLLLLAWNYRRAPGGSVRWVCAGFKILGFAALAFCLLEPLWSSQRARPGSNLFVVVADNSQGLQIKDRGASHTRGEMLRNLVDIQQAQWLGTLAENFEVRRYLFDTRLQASRDFSELNFDGRASAIGSALRTIAERYHGRPLAGILLLTDGNATDVHEAPAIPGLPPVYPVVIGSREPIRDISIQQSHATETDFEDAPVSVQADVSASGFADRTIQARLMDAAGKPVAEQSLRARKDDETLAFHFQLRPEHQGLSFYHLDVLARPEPGPIAAAGSAVEATLANNRGVVVVNRGRGPYRVLYVSGRPNWEFKFLNRAVQEDDQLQLVALIRVARREPKFSFLGRAGETSNPLYRGFGEQSAENVERYDQPVLVRLNTRDEFELRGGFPRTAEELYGYHAVIVGDVEAEFFTPEQSALLQKFVSERGGGFLMLGGMESFQEGKYQRTPIGDMLPVYLDPVTDPRPAGPMHLNLTREGWLQPWARLRDNETDEKNRLQHMTPFQVFNTVREVKPGASVIATLADDSGKTFPAVAVQRFGQGRTAAVMVGDLWRWGFHDADQHRDMDKAWRQLVRWLVNDSPNRVELTAQPLPEDPNGAMRLQVRARDAKFQPLDNAGVTIEVQPVLADGASGAPTNSIRLQAEPSVQTPGTYEAVYVPRVTGGYRATATVTGGDGAEAGRAVAGWSTDLVAEEFRSLTPNVPLLESIARKTGGEVISAGALEHFARGLPGRRAPVMEASTTPFWHTPMMFGFALACFLAEWGLRRWKGMP